MAQVFDCVDQHRVPIQIDQDAGCVVTDSMAAAQALPAHCWLFKQNCALTPRQLLAWFASLCVVSLVIASGFALMGLWVVVPFAGLEMMLVGGAFLYYAQHAGDMDRIEIRPGTLMVQRIRAGKQQLFELNPAWTRVEYADAYKAKLVLRCQSLEVRLDKFIEDRLRPSVARELRLAIARATI